MAASMLNALPSWRQAAGERCVNRNSRHSQRIRAEGQRKQHRASRIEPWSLQREPQALSKHETPHP